MHQEERENEAEEGKKKKAKGELKAVTREGRGSLQLRAQVKNG